MCTIVSLLAIQQAEQRGRANTAASYAPCSSHALITIAFPLIIILISDISSSFEQEQADLAAFWAVAEVALGL